MGDTPNIASLTGDTSMSTMADKRNSAQEASLGSHAAKVARMEVAASDGLSGGVPPKIEEEPNLNFG